ncbi:MAG TPA: hypothetical protein PKH07_11330, partial [bacterium]|nr:hypothetical protein [bacterium]
MKIRSSRRFSRRILRKTLGVLVPPIAWSIRLVPFPAMLWVFEHLAPTVFLLFRNRRNRILENLQRALGSERDPRELRIIARDAVRNYARSLVELIYLNEPSKLFRYVDVRIEGENNLRDGLAQKRGVIVVTAHFGNWELPMLA